MSRLQELLAPAARLIGIALRKGSSSYPLHRGENMRPFFIVGSGRSGTTLLRRILMAHDDVYIPPETYELGHSVLDFRRCANLPWPIICKVVLSSFVFSEDFDSFPVKGLRPCFLSLRNVPREKRSLAMIIDHFYRYQASRTKPEFKIWGDKTPMNSFYLKEIDKVFPNARYIHVLRDGCDVIYSFLEMGRYSDIQEAADRWTQAVRRCQEFGRTRQDRAVEITYEEMVTDPEVTIEKVCSFIGVNYDQEMIHKMPKEPLGDVETKRHHFKVTQPISTESIGKGRAKLTAEQRRILHEKISDQLETVGYPPVLGQ